MTKKKLLTFIMTILFSLNLVGCTGQYAQKSDMSIEDFTEVEFDELMNYKDSYLGDNSAVINIVSKLPANGYQSSFSLQTKEKPYGMTINYKLDDQIEDENYLNFWSNKNPENLLEKNAIALFSLIPNVDLIDFEINGSDQLADQSYTFSRKALESKYELDLVDISLDKNSFDAFYQNKEQK